MAAPKFSTSQAKSQSRPRRRYTLAEANRSLPLVTRIVRDIVNYQDRVSQLQQKLEESSGKDAIAFQGQLDATMERLHDYSDELKVLGIELKDSETGLIDFPGRHQGREVYLCWKMGEEKVTHWHEISAGYAGRQPVSKLQED